jgi:exodeoxyribonuclease-1
MNVKNMPTIYWYDFETWGANPQKDIPCQFAGIRTDYDLNIISEPLMAYNQIPNDCLPQPQACLITGITPQKTIEKGLIERDFIAKIHHEFSQAQTCVAGYNSIRFDDEVTRYALYRNFYDPYAREWQNGNSRWDIIDLARACYALRPEGIKWPKKDNGLPSFKLEDLTRANNIEHQAAHDAMSDVYATIAIAKLIRHAQPKLYEYVFNLRKKQQTAELIDCQQLKPLVHVSSKLPSEQGCCTWVVPIGFHPVNKNAVIVINLAQDPTPLFNLSPTQIREKLYTPTSMLDEGEERLPLKLIHLNKCPILAPAKTLTEDNAARLNIDRQRCLTHLQLIKSAENLIPKLQEVYVEQEERETPDADYALYSGGFIPSSDKALMQTVVSAGADEMVELSLPFQDKRLNTLLFRYRARNFPQSLSQTEIDKWQAHRQFKLTDPSSQASIILSDYLLELEQLMDQYQNHPDKVALLKHLYAYASHL